MQHVALVSLEGEEVALAGLVEFAGDRPVQQRAQQKRTDAAVSDDDHITLTGSWVGEHGIDGCGDAALFIGCGAPSADALLGVGEECFGQLLKPFRGDKAGCGTIILPKVFPLEEGDVARGNQTCGLACFCLAG